jgi:ABC-2 type transport system permease protein
MMLSDIYTIWLREMTRFKRDKSRIVSSIAMPFVWLIFMGFGLGASFQQPGVNYTTFLAPGILGMVVLFTSIFSGVSVIWDRQFGFLKEILVAPVSRTSIVLGKTIGGATVALISAMLMLVISIAMGVINISIGILGVIFFAFATALCFVSIGLIIASRMKSMEGFQFIMSFLMMPLFFLSGAIFPMQNAPQAMILVSHLDPLSYCVDGMRGLLMGQSIFPIFTDFIAIIIFALALTATAAYVFRKSMN